MGPAGQLDRFRADLRHRVGRLGVRVRRGRARSGRATREGRQRHHHVAGQRCLRAGHHRREHRREFRLGRVRHLQRQPEADQLPQGRHHHVDPGPRLDAVEPLQQPRGDRLLPRRTRRSARPVLRNPGTGLLLVSQGPLQYSGSVPADAGVEVLLPQGRQPAGRHGVRAIRRHRTDPGAGADVRKVAPFGWFIGAALGAIAYYLVTRGKPFVEGPIEEMVARPDRETVD